MGEVSREEALARYKDKPYEEIWGDGWWEHGPPKNSRLPGYLVSILDDGKIECERRKLWIPRIEQPIGTKELEKRIAAQDGFFDYLRGEVKEREVRKRAGNYIIGTIFEFLANCVFGGKLTGAPRHKVVLTSGKHVVADITDKSRKVKIESKAGRCYLKVQSSQLERYTSDILQDYGEESAANERAAVAGRSRSETITQVNYALWRYNLKRPTALMDLDSPAACEYSLLRMLDNSALLGVVLPLPVFLAVHRACKSFIWHGTDRSGKPRETIGKGIPLSLMTRLFAEPKATLEGLMAPSFGNKPQLALEAFGIPVEELEFRRLSIRGKADINGIGINVPPILVCGLKNSFYSQWIRDFAEAYTDAKGEKQIAIWDSGLGGLTPGKKQEPCRNPEDLEGMDEDLLLGSIDFPRMIEKRNGVKPPPF